MTQCGGRTIYIESLFHFIGIVASLLFCDRSLLLLKVNELTSAAMNDACDFGELKMKASCAERRGEAGKH